MSRLRDRLMQNEKVTDLAHTLRSRLLENERVERLASIVYDERIEELASILYDNIEAAWEAENETKDFLYLRFKAEDILNKSDMPFLDKVLSRVIKINKSKPGFLKIRKHCNPTEPTEVSIMYHRPLYQQEE